MAPDRTSESADVAVKKKNNMALAFGPEVSIKSRIGNSAELGKPRNLDPCRWLRQSAELLEPLYLTGNSDLDPLLRIGSERHRRQVRLEQQNVAVWIIMKQLLVLCVSHIPRPHDPRMINVRAIENVLDVKIVFAPIPDDDQIALPGLT